MKLELRFMCLIGALTWLLVGCTLLPDMRGLIQESEEWLPLAPIDGILIQMVADVDFDYREVVEGAELVSNTGTWSHKVEGRLLHTQGWQPHRDQIDTAHGSGRIHCYHPGGPEYDWTVQWSGDISFDERHWQTAAPLLHIAVYDDDALVLYAPPAGFHHWHPGSRDDCQNPEPVAPHQATADVWFPLDDVDVERAPDAETSSHPAVQDGIILLRIPLEELKAGTSVSNTVSLEGTHKATYETYQWGLGISLTLNSDF